MTEDEVRLEVLRIAAAWPGTTDVVGLAQQMLAFVSARAPAADASRRRKRVRATREEVERAVRLVEGGATRRGAAEAMGFATAKALWQAAQRFGLALPPGTDKQRSAAAVGRAVLAAKRAAA